MEQKTEPKEMKSNNWMLDEVIETVHKYYDNKDELIKRLAVQKMKYGIICLSQFVSQNDVSNNAYKACMALCAKLEKKIKQIISE